jgi:hypothetical protein
MNKINMMTCQSNKLWAFYLNKDWPNAYELTDVTSWLLGSGVPRPKTREPAAGPGGSPEDHRLWLRQANHGPHMDPLWHSGIPRHAGCHTFNLYSFCTFVQIFCVCFSPKSKWSPAISLAPEIIQSKGHNKVRKDQSASCTVRNIKIYENRLPEH